MHGTHAQRGDVSYVLLRPLRNGPFKAPSSPVEAFKTEIGGRSRPDSLKPLEVILVRFRG